MSNSNNVLQQADLRLFADELQSKAFDGYIIASQNKITNDLGRLPKPSKIDTVTGTATIKTSVATYILENYEALKKLRGSTSKLFNFALSELFTTAPQVYAPTKKELKQGIKQEFLTDSQRTVSISLIEYIAITKGVTPDDVKAMSKEAKKRVVRDTKEDLRTLRAIEIVQDKTQHKNTLHGVNFVVGGVIEWGQIRNGYITLRFNREFATALKIANYYGVIPNSVLAIDGNHPTAYKLGLYLTNLQLNQKDHKQRVSIQKIIDYLELPTPEELKQRQKTFNNVVFTPIENALDFLIEQGTLTEYYYSKAKDEKLTDSELEQITRDYELAKKCFVTFTCKDVPDKQGG